MSRQTSRSTPPQEERGSNEPRFLIIGQVRRPHGVRGELKVSVYSDQPERFTWLETVYVSKREGDADIRPIPVKNVRFQNQDVLLKLEGVETREAADLLRKHWLKVPIEEAIPLEEGEYYLYQLEGLAVWTDDGTHLGELDYVLETGANNVFVVKGSKGELLLPDIPEVVKTLDIEGKKIVVTLLPGLL